MVREAQKRALEVMYNTATSSGFMASAPSKNSEFSYPQIWARDNGVMAFGAIVSGDAYLIATVRKFLLLMKDRQSGLGRIPMNINCETGEEGKENAGSADSNLWYILAFYIYYTHTNDEELLRDLWPSIHYAYRWLMFQDHRECGLIEIQPCGNWMDQFSVQNSTIYDNVLWYAVTYIHEKLHTEVYKIKSPQSQYPYSSDIRDKINCLMWVGGCWNPDHTAMHARKLMNNCRGWLSSYNLASSKLTSLDYYLSWIGYRDCASWCDGLGNTLAVLTGVADATRADIIVNYFKRFGMDEPYPLRTIDSPIYPGSRHWRNYFKHRELNLPGRYHNGGYWPMVGGFYTALLGLLGRKQDSHKALVALARANKLSVDKDNQWEFNEWICNNNGYRGTPAGVKQQGWSASNYLFAHYVVINGEAPLFSELRARTLDDHIPMCVYTS